MKLIQLPESSLSWARATVANQCDVAADLSELDLKPFMCTICTYYLVSLELLGYGWLLMPEPNFDTNLVLTRLEIIQILKGSRGHVVLGIGRATHRRQHRLII